MNFDNIYQHSKNLLNRYGKDDRSSYTSDRKILWIGSQPLFSKESKFIKGIEDRYIKSVASDIYADHDFILIAGGNTEIGMHRDASYAAAKAISINLGGEAYFEHEDLDPQRLEHGDITEFNCKKLHGILEADCDRIVIAIWKRNPKW
ncbi:MAG: hypothetical protein IM596_07900 [Pseudanabaena sp. M051S1SP2A07QC]|nr:hypothetical protein [Pseudanabaena sp. M109S1SP2A07QC]MCA6521765.1 hypothetical protein [Pseudanabaena sp. M051S1SP2A07QC]